MPREPTLAAIAAAKFTEEDARVISRAIFDWLAGWYHKDPDPAVPLSVLEMAVQHTLVEWPQNSN